MFSASGFRLGLCRQGGSLCLVWWVVLGRFSLLWESFVFGCWVVPLVGVSFGLGSYILLWELVSGWLCVRWLFFFVLCVCVCVLSCLVSVSWCLVWSVFCVFPVWFGPAVATYSFNSISGGLRVCKEDVGYLFSTPSLGGLRGLTTEISTAVIDC